MANEVLNITYASSLTDLCEVNHSFDSGILRIAYVGDNRNHSSISKEVFERCLPTIYNCPVVCNYDRESDTLGGHDMEIVASENGLRLVNVTQPVGVIPQGAKVFWETVEEDDGISHEYLCAEALIWKRQEAYRKIKEDGITAQSMEITIKDGAKVDGIYHIKDFEFTAFALIGCEPCYESASLAFAKQDFKQQLSEMMLELKDTLQQVNTSEDVDNKSKFSMEGGTEDLDKKQLIEKYGIDIETLDFSIDDFSVEELEEKFKAMTETDPEGGEPQDGSFSLTSNVVEEIHSQLALEKVQREWGESCRYCYVDCDFEKTEVYAWDTNDWLLYGFTYTVNGDSVKVDFDTKKRMKYAIEEFDEGTQESNIAGVFTEMEAQFTQKVTEASELEAKFTEVSAQVETMSAELEELRTFKKGIEDNAAEQARNEIFAKFDEELVGIEAYENLKADCEKFSLEELEDKCYAIRGRNMKANFNLEPQGAPKLPVDRTGKEKLPYNGIFEKYGISLDK